MKHPTNCDLFAYWNERRGYRLAPSRTDIEPAAIRHILGDTLVLAADTGEYPFRLAGTRLCALFGRELKGESFASLWNKSDHAAVRQLLSVVVEEKVGVVAQASGAPSSDAVLALGLELILLPLEYETPADARVLGALAPMAAPYWLGARTIGPLSLGMFRHIGAAAEAIPAPRFSAMNGRVRHGLTVYEGGRAGAEPSGPRRP